MFAKTKTSITILASVIAVAVSSAAWGAKLDGEYSGTGNSFFEKLTFKSGGKVRVTFMGMTKVGTYEIEDNEVLITVGNETNVFTLDDQGCVVGGGLLGKYCKGGVAKGKADKSPGGDKDSKSAGADQSSSAQSGGKAARLSGVYKTGNREATITLDFKTENKVSVMVSGTKMKKESTEATYKVAGDQVTITTSDGGAPLILTRKGNVLEGAPDGESMKLKFVKK